jgi:nucleoid-associated protein YgaU
MFATKTFLRMLAVAAIALVVWSVVARPSGAHGRRTVYEVKAYDTLWSIASRHYGGDVRSAIFQIEQRNHLSETTALTPGERLILP